MSLRRSLEFDYHRVVERFAGCRSAPQRSAALQTALSEYNLKSIAYLMDNVSGLTESGPYISTTYSATWVEHYRRKYYFETDPVIEVGLQSIIPADWQNFDMSDRRVSTMFGEAREHGLGRHGLTIPIRGRAGERGVLSITTEDSDQTWHSDLKIYMRDFMILAVFYHNSILESEGVKTARVRLSDREIECLKWAAAGKTHADIATILTISHHTARAHLDTARQKLNALNIPHAVARAISLGIIG